MDCGKRYLPYHHRQKRCHDCSGVVHADWAEKNAIIRQARYNFAIKTKVSPEEAKQLLEKMRKEEGPEFADMMLDGVFEQVTNQECNPIPKCFGITASTWVSRCRKCGKRFKYSRKVRLKPYICLECVIKNRLTTRLRDFEIPAGGE